MSANDLHVCDGCDTKALNCKPNTNLKEKNELSNICKTSGFILHAVIGSTAHLVLNGSVVEFLFCRCN